uniref:Cytochrome c biogenesis protein Ccs1 n=1 Tax=Polysiphonia sertularioides TaxID=945028 RepID=A0A1Z1MGL9_9FLOR|nr:cytochrome c biogenesis protein ccs1 [Polysiphonia sertularioides]
MIKINTKTVFWKLLKSLANLKLALLILFTISCFCIIGSVIEQDQNKIYYITNYGLYGYIIIFCGLDHLFKNWWFIAILSILVANLTSCSLVTQLPSLKNARRWKFIHSGKNSNRISFKSRSSCNSNYISTNIVYSLLRLNFLVFRRGSSIYSYKGLYGRIAPIFVHVSIILILFGSVYGLLFSFVLQEMVPVGEMFHFKNIVYSGYYSNVNTELYAHLDNFYIDYSDKNLINQFFSNLSVYLRNKRLISYSWLSVNHPLCIKKITFYQTDWEMTGLRIKLGDQYFLQKKLAKQIKNNNLAWATDFYIASHKKVLILSTKLNNKVLILNPDASILQEVSLGQRFYLNSVPISIEKVIPSTGLQVKFDPGVPLVYLGFFSMIVSTFVSYLSYSQVWIYIAVDSLEFAGSTNRSVLFFEQDVVFIDKLYVYYLYYLPSHICLLDKTLR